MIRPTTFPSGNQLRDMCIKSLIVDQKLLPAVRRLIERPAFQAMLPELVLEDVFLAAPTFVDTFMSRLLSRSVPNEVHRIIAKCFTDVFTTNFDLCFEQSGAHAVHHLHGSIAKPESLQNRLFRLGATAQAALRRFRRVTHDRTLLIVGYSLRDADIIEALAATRPKHIYYLSKMGVAVDALDDLGIPYDVLSGSAESVFGAQVPAISEPFNFSSRLRLRAPAFYQQLNTLLHLMFRVADYEGAARLLKRFGQRIRGRARYKAMLSVANGLRIAGKYKRAEETCRQVLRSRGVHEAKLGDVSAHADVILGLSLLGQFSTDYDRIENHFQRALSATDEFARTDLAKGRIPGLNVWRARIHNNLGLVHTRTGKFTRAETAFRRSIALKMRHHEELGVAQTAVNLAKMLLIARRPLEATQALQKTVAIVKKSPDLYICKDALFELSGTLNDQFGWPRLTTLVRQAKWGRLRKRIARHGSNLSSRWEKQVNRDLQDLCAILIAIDEKKQDTQHRAAPPKTKPIAFGTRVREVAYRPERGSHSISTKQTLNRHAGRLRQTVPRND